VVDCACKKSKASYAYKVICWKELVEAWHVDGATIIGVPFSCLKGIRSKTTET